MRRSWIAVILGEFGAEFGRDKFGRGKFHEEKLGG